MIFRPLQPILLITLLGAGFSRPKCSDHQLITFVNYFLLPYSRAVVINHQNYLNLSWNAAIFEKARPLRR